MPTATGTKRALIQSFHDDQLPIRWRTPVSAGYSGPTVADGRVYVTDRVVKPEQIERVLCFDAKSGKSIWSYSYPCTYRGVQYTAGPRAAVTVDSDRAYSLGTMGHLLCFDAKAGELLWQRDLNSQYEIRMPIWGIAGSPLVYEDLVIVQIGGSDVQDERIECIESFENETVTMFFSLKKIFFLFLISF